MKTPTFLVISLITIILHSCREKEVENTSNSLSYNFPQELGSPTLPNDFVMTDKTVELGRFLFYDKILSSDQTISCASCHKQEFSFTDDAKFSTGVNGQLTDRNSMTIVNAAWQNSFFWDGRAATLEEQALGPIQNPVEMNLPIPEALKRLNESEFYKAKFLEAFGTETIDSTHLATAIADFERVLISNQTNYDKSIRGEYVFTEQEERGRVLFFTHPEAGEIRGGNCGDCHAYPNLMVKSFHNNGLNASSDDDIGLEEVTGNEKDRGKFKVPSLRNIALTAPYMHDGRFTTLKEVLDHYNEHIYLENPNIDLQITAATNNENETTLGLTETEKEDIIAFLKTLNDETLINDARFSDPF